MSRITAYKIRANGWRVEDMQEAVSECRALRDECMRAARENRSRWPHHAADDVRTAREVSATLVHWLKRVRQAQAVRS